MYEEHAEGRFEEAVALLERAVAIHRALRRFDIALQDFRRAMAEEMDVEAALRQAADLIRRPGAILHKL